MVSKDIVKELMQKYKNAWENRDPEAIIRIFTEDAVYKERAFEDAFIGHAGIKKYWEDKVVGEQENISLKPLNIYVDGNTAIVEWKTTFYDKIKNKNTSLKSVAIFEVRGGKISNWREYWHSKHE